MDIKKYSPFRHAYCCTYKQTENKRLFITWIIQMKQFGFNL